MPETHVYPHPNMGWYKLSQRLMAFLLGIMLLALPLQVLLAFLTGGGLFLLTAFMLGLLTSPLVMFLSASPPLKLSTEGITIQPLWWKERLIRWEDITEMKDYTLLPNTNSEVERRMLQGRKRYQMAQGKMLIVPSLSWQYRVAGYFAGEGGKPIIAVTNRTHTPYDDLIKRLEKHLS